MRSLLRTLLVLAFGGLSILSSLPTAEAQTTQRVYAKRIANRGDFDNYSRVIGSTRFAKFIIDIKTDDIYFIDVNVFKIHADFVLGVLQNKPWTADNIREYNKNYLREKPQFILGYITEHLKVDKMSFAFWEGDKIDVNGIVRVHKKLNETFFKKNLLYRPDSPLQEKQSGALGKRGIATITNDEIYQSSPYQAFNKGKAIGPLRIVKPGTPYESLFFDREDIVILQESYPDISPVAGILSSVFSTPLSHINLRATAWGIPNAGFRRAQKDYPKLADQIVYFEVRDQDHVLRKATDEEISEFQRRQKIRRTVPIPPADLRTASMPLLVHIQKTQASTFGSKTANLGEIASARLPLVNVPSGFGLPFFYYQKHMVDNGLDKKVDALLSDPKFESDARFRKASLATLREEIQNAPIAPEVLDAIYKRARLKLDKSGLFVRSSTNAEDLPGFNGAGLYDTVPNVRGKKALGQAIRQVWASLWNYRAVEERSLFGIDHRAVYAGVLVQTGVNATSAGVLITTNLFNPEDQQSYTINAKRGLGIRVVEGTRVPEQILFDVANKGTKIISRSDDPIMLVFDEKGGIREVPNTHKGVILTEERAETLATAVQSFVPLFSQRDALDVEWLLEEDKVWIVQARPYVR